jgi:DNA-binding transcriptional ArsR family regulator
MSKNNLLLVDLNDKKTKKLAETITSETSRKILNHLAEKEHDTEANISKDLSIPISTVHYHLQKLQESSLISVDEFHYSPKGREVNHYSLANKYIIIAPKKISGLKQKLKNILPVALTALGISAIIKLFTSFTGTSFGQDKVMAVERAVLTEVADEMAYAAPEAAKEVAQSVSSQPDIAFWFLIGSVSTIALYLVIGMVKEWIKKN